MLRTISTAILLVIVATGASAAAAWHHPLYLANGGYWSTRLRVDVHNASDAAVAGTPVSVKVGRHTGQADLVGAAAEAVRVVDINGAEMLFAIYGPSGELLTHGPIPDQSDLFIPAVCPPRGDASYYVYFGNPAAWPVPDFLEISPDLRSTKLDHSSPAALTAMAAAPETRVLTEAGATADWYDGNPSDGVHWDYRFPVTVINVSDAASAALAQVNITPALARLRDANPNSLRITDGSGLVPHHRIGNTVLFEAVTKPRTIRTYYLYLSTDKRVPAPGGADYAALMNSRSNLVKNPSFEEGQPLPAQWSARAASGVPMGIDTPGIFGAHAARVDVPPTARREWSGWQQNVPVQPGKTYLYAVWVKCRDVSGEAVGAYAHYLNAAGEPCRTTESCDAGQPISGTHDWALMSGVFTVPPDCATFQVHLTTNAYGTVWHDGVVLSEVTPAVLGKLESRTPAKPGLAVWPVNPVAKVFQDDLAPTQPPPARISAARNEKEPLQLAIRSAESLRGLTVNVEPPTHAAGAQLTDIAVNVVGYVPVDHPSSYYQSAVPAWQRKYPTDAGQSDGWPGWWPDPLLPRNTVDLTANTTQPVWVTVGIPEDAPAGDYAGKMKLSDASGVRAELPFTVHVWNFALPDERHLPAIFDIRLNHLWETPGKTMDQVRADLELAMSEHRVSPDGVRPDPEMSYRNGVVTADFSAFDRLAERYFDDLKLPHTYTPHYFYAFTWGNPPAEFMDEKPYPGDYPYASADPSRLRPEYKTAYQTCLRAYWDHMKAKGWDKKVVLYLADEPADSDPRIVAQLRALADMVHEVDPAIPIYVSTWRHVPEWDGSIDIWGIGHYGPVPPDEMAQIRAKGARLRFTTDGQMCIDTPYLAVERLLPHYCSKYGVEGYEFWGVSWLVNYNPYQFGWFPYIHQSDKPGASYYIRYPNGDGFLAYPGALIGYDKPVSSIRLEQAREGEEDYEYLYLLRDYVGKAKASGKSAEAAEAALRDADKLVTIPNAGGKYSTEILPDPDAVFAVREEVARAIEGFTLAPQ